MPMFFNPSCRRMPPQSNMPFYQNPNNIQNPNIPFMPNLLNPERPFAEEMKREINTDFQTNKNTTVNSQLEEYLQQYIQDEKNASKYYESLAEKTNIEKNKKLLYSISKNALDEISCAKRICSSLSINPKEPKDKSINTLVTFSGGITLALEEENDSLNRLSHILENENSDVSIKLTPFVLRKLSRINSLYLIYYKL